VYPHVEIFRVARLSVLHDREADDDKPSTSDSFKSCSSSL
jgi:hypothetical protein